MHHGVKATEVVRCHFNNPSAVIGISQVELNGGNGVAFGLQRGHHFNRNCGT
jgi:hypothetical protein